jgi:hypothetical protein
MNLYKDKVKYICEFDRKLRVKKYYKIQYLSELNMWGRKRPITEQTFLRRIAEGFESEYKQIKITKDIMRKILWDIDTLIDMSLDTKDKEWFVELSKQKNILLEYFL